jgi:hypothetical protein
MVSKFDPTLFLPHYVRKDASVRIVGMAKVARSPLKGKVIAMTGSWKDHERRYSELSSWNWK